MAEQMQLQNPLTVGTRDKHSIAWWGVWMLIITEAALFGYLLVSYFYLSVQADTHWPPEGHPALIRPGINTVILLASSGFVMWSERCIRRGKTKRSLLPMAIAILLGFAFIGNQCIEWKSKSYGLTTNLYGSLYFTITGFHMAHVAVGLIVLSLLGVWTALGHFGERRYIGVTIGGLYWHFVDAVWLVIFSSLYLVPYWQGL